MNTHTHINIYIINYNHTRTHTHIYTSTRYELMVCFYCHVAVRMPIAKPFFWKDTGISLQDPQDAPK